ncbi:phage holin family protein [Shewanella frigidimarina]|nr:phage holin family protein [Shewanella frigidimarina]
MMENTDDVCSKDKISDGTQSEPHVNSDEMNVNVEEIKDIFNKVSKLAQEVGQWSESTVQLFFMEVLRNVAAAKQFFVCQLLFIPLLVLFIFSLCVCTGIVLYSITLNTFIGVGGFLLAMMLVLVGLLYWQKRLIRFFGFKETVSQLKEGIDVISKASKSFD